MLTEHKYTDHYNKLTKIIKDIEDLRNYIMVDIY